MFGTLTTLLAFAFVLGVLVFVHELGHFLAAKRVGIKVLKFQLGFNPTILKYKRGDTEYSIGALPLGGYVKMAGDNPDEARSGASDEFLSKSKWERFQVLIMGPAMNLILAVILTAVVLYVQGADHPAYLDQPVVIGAVTPNSPAAQADIEPGDRITSVAGHSVATWDAFELAIGTRSNREVEIELEREGTPLTKSVTPTRAPGDSRFDIGEIGVFPNSHPFIRTVQPGSAAERAGLRAGDVVVSIDGERIAFSSQLRAIVSQRAERRIELAVQRDGAVLTIPATPDRRDGRGLLGIDILDEFVTVRPGLLEASRMSVERNVQIAGMIFQTVAGLLTRETSPTQLMGPVAIAQLSGEAAGFGIIALLALMSQISLNLGLVNLLPIPILDGGHIFIMALEGIARRDFSVRLKEKMLMAGFVVLMTLMVTVIYNDLTRISWIERLMPWR